VGDASLIIPIGDGNAFQHAESIRILPLFSFILL